MPARPDVVVILTDQERAAPPYEGAALAAWRERALVGRQWFEDHGVSFARHYTGSLACVPSRPTLLTGQYPDVHGVTQTDGMAKLADDPRMRWLRPGEVPTLGHWFRAGGYDTHYDGKWHVSHADLLDPVTGAPLATNTATGEVLPAAVQAYLDADPLAPFGFSGWVGPEPHGPRVADAGLCRDPLIAARVVAWLEARYAARREGDPAATRPFLLIASFVNPHDIVFFPAWALRSPLGRSPMPPPPVPAAPTADQDLSTRPAAQAAYRAAYARAYGPGFAVERIYRWRAAAYRELYYRLHAEVDGPIDRVRRAVTAGSTDALLVHTADHGDLLGAHGGMHQKWGSLYDEATRVPLRIAGIGACATRPARIAEATSHVDLVPTLVAAAGLDTAAIARELAARFTEVHPLPGRDLMPVVRGAAADATRAVYLMTRDDVLDGASASALMWRRAGVALPLPPAIRAAAEVGSSFEGLIARVAEDQASGGGGHLWKLVRSFDDPATWTEPGARQRTREGSRSWPLADAWELYDLDADPIEADDRAHTAPAVFAHLARRLDGERARAVPARRTPWPYAPEPATRTIEARRARIIAADPARVWATLADFGAIATWAPPVRRATRLDAGPLAVGSARHVHVGPVRLTERIVHLAPPAVLGYRIEGLPGVVRAVVNTWRIEATDGGALVSLTTTIEPRTWRAGTLVAELVARGLARSSEQLLAGLAAHLAQ
ncbi:MAG: sulfatase-like hydrolase/transferase [Deltaproteobacteria bacterium]|nr:sulfatase-like hydrolase/transferase [Deltaproteobacteria bacterium]